MEAKDFKIFVTGGSEINPKTMESKLIKGLYFAGRISGKNKMGRLGG